MGDGDREGLVGAVEHILRLVVLTGGGTVDALFIGGPQLLHLIGGEDQLVALLALGLQAKELLNVGQHGLKGGLVGLIGGHIVAVVLGEGDLLVLQQIQISVVVGSGEADGQAAGLMVAGDQDEGLVSMLLGEVDGHLYRIGQGLGIVDGGGGVVGVAGPVDLAALAHHKEAGVVVQHFDALGYIVSQSPHVVGAVQLIGHGVGVGQVLVDDDGFLCIGADGVGLGVGLGHGVAGLLGQLIQVGLVSAAAGGLEQSAAGKVVEARLDQLQADLIVAAAAGLMGIEGGRGGVVQVDGGDDADLPALLGFQLLGNGLILDGAGLIHIDRARVGLVAGGDGGGGGSGVGGEGVGVIGDGGAGSLKVHKVEVLGAVEDGALVVIQAGLGLPVVSVLQGTQVVGGGLDLGVAHAVPDEQEDVFRGLDGRGRSGSQSGGMRFLRLLRDLGGVGGAAGQRGGGQGTGQKCGCDFFHVCLFLPISLGQFVTAGSRLF